MSSLGTKRSFWIWAGPLLVVAVLLLIFFQSKEFKAQRILSRSYKKYASLTSYSSTGTTVDEVGDGRSLPATFSMKLGRSDLYLVEYEQHAATFTNKGAVWSDSTGDYFQNDMVAGPPGFSKFHFSNDLNGIIGNQNRILDISGGTTAIVPAIFFQPLKKHGIKAWIARLTLQKHRDWIGWSDPEKWTTVSLATVQDTKVGNIDCDVLSANFRNGHALLWIGKTDYLVHQSREWVKYGDSETTDQILARILVPGMQAPLPMEEMKRRIDEGRMKAEATMKQVTVSFADKAFVPKVGSTLTSMTVDPPLYRVYTQTYHDIVLNPALISSNFIHTNTNTVFIPAPTPPGSIPTHSE